MPSIQILEETPHYLALLKPAGMLSQPSEKPSDTPDVLSALHTLRISPVYPVHRLDRETAGVMLVALTEPGAAKLSALVSSGGLHKTYLAVVRGRPAEQSAEWTDLLFRDARRNKSYVVDRRRAGVKEARLAYDVIGTVQTADGPLSLVRVRLYTGRTHQIRVQFSHRGLPLVGDGRYGGGGGTLSLFAARLAFTCPFCGREKTFTALPSDGAFTLFDELSSENAANLL